MPTKKSSKARRRLRASSMFPRLHQDVSDAVSDAIGSPWFNREDSYKDSDTEHSTYVMGSFTCKTGSCSNDGWGSKTVGILIRRYPKNGYNAVIFGQRCRSCKQFGSLILDEPSYVDRIEYRLKKWAGIDVRRQHYSPKNGRPHMTELCEGCKRGYCRQRYRSE